MANRDEEGEEVDMSESDQLQVVIEQAERRISQLEAMLKAVESSAYRRLNFMSVQYMPQTQCRLCDATSPPDLSRPLQHRDDCVIPQIAAYLAARGVS